VQKLVKLGLGVLRLKNTITWNSIVFGLANHGYYKETIVALQSDGEGRGSQAGSFSFQDSPH